jgi:hypothetical protein
MAAISTAFIGLFVLLHTIEASDPVLAAIFILLAGFYWQNRLRLVDCVRRVFGPLRVVGPGE